MKTNPLLQTKGPWLHLLLASESEACDRMWALPTSTSSQVVARLIRGHKAKTTEALFDEFAAALQFPCYFGENWDAFDECVNDLEWLSGNAYVLLITNSNRLLDQERPEELNLLLHLLASAGTEWAKAIDGERPRPAKPFHTVLQCMPEDEHGLRNKLHASGKAYNPLK
jgi:hypothetical protein